MRKLGVRGWSAAMVAAGLALGTVAVAQDGALQEGAPQGQAAMSDAQVESNVLRALASAPDLSTQNIQSTTVYGVVTLKGSVQDEALRTRAENLAARADGVKKVVDELGLGATADAAPRGSALPGQADQRQDQGAPDGQVLQSDGTYAPAPPDEAQPGNPQGAPGAPMDAQGGPQGPPQPGRQPMAPGYGQGGYGQGGPGYGQGYAQGYAPQGPGAGQRAGLPVTVPPGAMLRIRIDRGIDSNHIQPGTPFSGTVLTDVVAAGAVAIPRGATVQGTVVDAKKAGALKGRGELALAVNQVTLGGMVYPLVTEPWDREGRDKTAKTVDRAIGLGALGALFGAAAGGGSGAAIGAAIGGGAGVASSAASPGGRIMIPPESVLNFRVAQPVAVKTLSEQEMARLSYAAGPNPGQGRRPMRRYYSPYYGYYYGPGL